MSWNPRVQLEYQIVMFTIKTNRLLSYVQYVLVCGDDAVGKTSIIDAKSSGTFSKDVEDLKGSVDNSGAWGEVVVPGEDVNGSVTEVIIDTSSRTTKRMEVLNKMKDGMWCY